MIHFHGHSRYPVDTVVTSVWNISGQCSPELCSCSGAPGPGGRSRWGRRVGVLSPCSPHRWGLLRGTGRCGGGGDTPPHTPHTPAPPPRSSAQSGPPHSSAPGPGWSGGGRGPGYSPAPLPASSSPSLSSPPLLPGPPSTHSALLFVSEPAPPPRLGKLPWVHWLSWSAPSRAQTTEPFSRAGPCPLGSPRRKKALLIASVRSPFHHPSCWRIYQKQKCRTSSCHLGLWPRTDWKYDRPGAAVLWDRSSLGNLTVLIMAEEIPWHRWVFCLQHWRGIFYPNKFDRITFQLIIESWGDRDNLCER